MFVEIVRLFIVFLATAAGFALGQGGAAEPGSGAIVGATLGASVGYVAGGVVGRQLRRVMGAAERRVDQLHPAQLLAGALGAGALGVLSALIGMPAVMLLPGRWGWPFLGLLVWVGVYEGWSIGSHKSRELLGLAGLSFVAPAGDTGGDAVLVDTSAAIDGRLLALSRAGFLPDRLLVPRFVLDELQSLADAQDDSKRRRGRRALELLDAVRRENGVTVDVVHDEVPEHDEVDAKLVALARRRSASLLTVDAALQRVAELQGVHCFNLNRLADAMRPVHVTGEVIRVPITREGREPGQGIGFLDDGTMVVVGDAAALLGREVDVRITGNVQTSVGRMLFASLASAG